MKLGIAFLITLFALPLILIAASDTDGPLWENAVPATRGEVKAAMRAAGTYSRYKVPMFARPEVYVVPDEVIWAHECGGTACPIAGVTLWKGTHRIYIAASVPIDRRDDILVHEITHWLQFRSGWMGKGDDCRNSVAQEVEAYSVQHLYRILHENEHNRFWMPDFSCPGDTL